MEESLALLIVGGVLSFMGIAMNINPIKFDEDLLGALEGELSDRENMLRNFGAQLRTVIGCLLYTSPSPPRDATLSRMPSSA